jgi:hypothetical protein
MTQRFRQNVSLLREDGAVPEPWSSVNSFASESEADQTDHDANVDANFDEEDAEREAKKLKRY